MAIQRLQEKYQKEVANVISKEFGIENKMAIPRVEKVVINVGVGKVTKNKELMENLKRDLAAISGQKPSVRLSRVSIASFNLRRGMPVGIASTLRKEKMYAFLDRFFNIVLPRLRDFRGVGRKSFDKNGNYTIGFPEHTVFPEVDITKSTPYGLEITIVINSGDPKVSERLLELMGMPFEKKENK